MARQLPHASLVESAQFNEAVIIPNALQGLFKRRPTAVGIATRAGVDGRAIRLMSGLRARHGNGPLWVKTVTGDALVLLDVADVQRVLEGSPSPFASDPEAKRKGMGHFQPDALTLSRGDLWANRSAFTEAVLDSGDDAHRLADRFVAIVADETTGLTNGVLDHDSLHAVMRRIVRRVVLGDRARDDEGLSDELAGLMSEANALPDDPSPRLALLMARLDTHVAAAEPGTSLAGLFADAPHDADTRVVGQVPHWLFALQDTLTLNVLRALALLAVHDDTLSRARDEVAATDLQSGRAVAQMDWVRCCLEDAMRLYPTTPLLSREVLSQLSWDGVTVQPGANILIVNAFFHRDPETVAYADRFAPEEWLDDGPATQTWAFNHFSHGPQGCPGVNLSLLIASALLAQLLQDAAPRLTSPTLDPTGPLPHMLNPFAIQLAFG